MVVDPCLSKEYDRKNNRNRYWDDTSPTNRLPHRGNNKVPTIQFISTIYKIFGKTQESISRDPRSIAKPYKWIDIIYVIMFNNTHWKYFFKTPGLTVKQTNGH